MPPQTYEKILPPIRNARSGQGSARLPGTKIVNPNLVYSQKEIDPFDASVKLLQTVERMHKRDRKTLEATTNLHITNSSEMQSELKRPMWDARPEKLLGLAVPILENVAPELLASKHDEGVQNIKEGLDAQIGLNNQRLAREDKKLNISLRFLNDAREERKRAFKLAQMGDLVGSQKFFDLSIKSLVKAANTIEKINYRVQQHQTVAALRYANTAFDESQIRAEQGMNWSAITRDGATAIGITIATAGAGSAAAAAGLSRSAIFLASTAAGTAYGTGVKILTSGSENTLHIAFGNKTTESAFRDFVNDVGSGVKESLQTSVTTAIGVGVTQTLLRAGQDGVVAFRTMAMAAGVGNTASSTSDTLLNLAGSWARRESPDAQRELLRRGIIALPFAAITGVIGVKRDTEVANIFTKAFNSSSGKMIATNFSGLVQSYVTEGKLTPEVAAQSIFGAIADMAQGRVSAQGDFDPRIAKLFVEMRFAGDKHTQKLMRDLLPKSESQGQAIQRFRMMSELLRDDNAVSGIKMLASISRYNDKQNDAELASFVKTLLSPRTPAELVQTKKVLEVIENSIRSNDGIVDVLFKVSTLDDPKWQKSIIGFLSSQENVKSLKTLIDSNAPSIRNLVDNIITLGSTDNYYFQIGKYITSDPKVLSAVVSKDKGNILLGLEYEQVKNPEILDILSKNSTSQLETYQLLSRMWIEHPNNGLATSGSIRLLTLIEDPNVRRILTQAIKTRIACNPEVTAVKLAEHLAVVAGTDKGFNMLKDFLLGVKKGSNGMEQLGLFIDCICEGKALSPKLIGTTSAVEMILKSFPQPSSSKNPKEAEFDPSKQAKKEDKISSNEKHPILDELNLDSRWKGTLSESAKVVADLLSRNPRALVAVERALDKVDIPPLTRRENPDLSAELMGEEYNKSLERMVQLLADPKKGPALIALLENDSPQFQSMAQLILRGSGGLDPNVGLLERLAKLSRGSDFKEQGIAYRIFGEENSNNGERFSPNRVRIILEMLGDGRIKFDNNISLEAQVNDDNKNPFGKLRRGIPGYVRKDLTSEDYLRVIRKQLRTIAPDEVGSLVKQFPTKDQDEVRQVLSRLTLLGSMEGIHSFRDSIVHLLTDSRTAHSLPDNAKHKVFTPHQGSLGDLLMYLETKKGSFGSISMAGTNILEEASIIILDNVILSRISNDPQFAERIAHSKAKLIYPRSWQSGANLFSSPDLQNLASKVSGTLDEARKVISASNGKVFSVHEALDQILDRPLESLPENLRSRVEIVDNRQASNISNEAIAEQINGSQEPSTATIEAAIKLASSKNSETSKEDANTILELIIQNTHVFSPRSLAELSRKSFSSIEQVLRTKGQDPSKIYFISSDDSGELKSYDAIACLYQHANSARFAELGIGADRFLPGTDELQKGIASGRIPPDAVIIIADDIAGTGASLCNQYESIVKKFKGQIIIAPLVCTTSAFRTLKDYAAKHDPSFPSLILNAYGIPDTHKSSLYSGMASSNQSRVVRAAGPIKSGFGDNGLLVSFPYMAPDNNATFWKQHFAKLFTHWGTGVKK